MFQRQYRCLKCTFVLLKFWVLFFFPPTYTSCAFLLLTRNKKKKVNNFILALVESYRGIRIKMPSERRRTKKKSTHPQNEKKKKIGPRGTWDSSKG